MSLRSKIVLGFIFLLVAIRAVLPIVGLRAINWALQTKMESYTGKLQDFDLSIYRGAYQLQGLTIAKKNSKGEPLLRLREADISIAWRELFLGKVLVDLDLDQLVVVMTDSESAEKKQTGNEESNWRDVLDALVPVSIERLRVKNSTFLFANADLTKSIPLRFDDIDFKVDDLKSRAGGAAENLSPFVLKAKLQNHADLDLNGRADVLAKDLRFEANLKIENFKPETLNTLLIHYVPVDITRGELNVYSEAAMSRGDLIGYANVFMKDFDIIAPRQNLVSLRHLGFEIGAAFANWFLKNNRNKAVAAHIPFERRSGKFKVDTSEAFWSAIKNRDGEMKPGFGQEINLGDLEKRLETRGGG